MYVLRHKKVSKIYHHQVSNLLALSLWKNKTNSYVRVSAKNPLFVQISDKNDWSEKPLKRIFCTNDIDRIRILPMKYIGLVWKCLGEILSPSKIAFGCSNVPTSLHESSHQDSKIYRPKSDTCVSNYTEVSYRWCLGEHAPPLFDGFIT